MAATSRNQEIDFWKSAAIFGVVWIHSAYLIPYRPAYLDILTPLFKFCVPVFLLYWSYFAEKFAQKPNYSYLKSLQKGKDLLIKFFFWSLVYWLLKWNFQDGLGHQISKYWSGYGWSGQYFFVILFQAILIYPWIRWLSRRISFLQNFVLTITLLLLGNHFLPVFSLLEKAGDRFVLYWVPYLVMGNHLANSKCPRIRLWPALAAVSLALISCNELYVHNSLLKIGPYLLPSVFLSTSLIGMTTTVGAIQWVQNSELLARLTGFISRNSMAIFCINPLVSILTRMAFPQMPVLEFWGAGLVMPVANTLAVLLASLGVSWSMQRIRLGRLVSN